MTTLKSRQTPQTRRDDTVETMHGEEVRDPYRWLEDESSEEVARWTAEQNAYTRSFLDVVPGRERIHRRLSELLSIGSVTAPKVRGDRYFYTRREGDQNQPVLMLRQGLHGSERLLLDPNNESTAGTVVLDWWYPSADGRLIAYGYSDHGDEKSTLYLVDVESHALLPDVIPYTRYSSVAWEADGQGFYYTRFPAPGSVPDGEENYHQHVFYHRLRTDPAGDPHIFGEGRDMTEMPFISASTDHCRLLIAVYQGWARSEVFWRDMSSQDAEVHAVVTGEDAIFDGEIVGGTLFLRTNLHAPRYKVAAVDLSNADPANWREVIPERHDTTIELMHLAAGYIVLNALRDVSSHAELYSLEGEARGEVPLPPLCSITALEGEHDGDHLFVGFESYITPPTVLSYDPATQEAERWAEVEGDIGVSSLRVEQVWYRSTDGTRVPMTIISPKGIALDGNNPMVLNGYGGFNVSMTPLFNRNILAWLEIGGVYALANMRGGSEFGEEWHRAGMMGNKQNVFDDFYAAAEYLIKDGYTRPERLGIWGRSNGGLLVGAALTQRPELFGAVVCQVPLLDMLRYHHYRIAKLWVAEYGSPEDPEHYRWLRAYSPYHNVRAGEDYPAVLFTTAWSDSRVDPMHARKMGALLQAENSSGRPVLVRVEEEAGHGQGKPISKLVDEMADVWSFLVWQLGVNEDTQQPSGEVRK